MWLQSDIYLVKKDASVRMEIINVSARFPSHYCVLSGWFDDDGVVSSWSTLFPCSRVDQGIINA